MIASNLFKTTTESTNYFYLATPSCAVDILIPYLKARNLNYIWECACGLGHITKVLEENSIEVYQSDITSFSKNEGKVHEIDFIIQTELPDKNIKAIITNPPYKIKDKFLKKCYELKKPFALLMPLRALGAKARVDMYMQYGIELLVPDKRINFIYHKPSENNWFHSAWFCYGILPEKLIFTRMPKNDRNKDQLRFS